MHNIHITNKGKIMDTLEKFYIYRETKTQNQFNDDKSAVQNKAIFETIVYEDPYWLGPLPNIQLE
jgi:hypothetical protein